MDIVVPLRSWLILLGFLLFIGLSIYWGIRGSIPTKIWGRGIMLAQGGVFNIFTPGAGCLRGISVKPEQLVKKGEVLAAIEHPELTKEIQAAKQRLKELTEGMRVTFMLQQSERLTQADLSKRRRANLMDSLEVLKSQKKVVVDLAKEQEKLQKKGLLTKQTVIESQREIQRLEGVIRDTEHLVKQLPADSMELSNRQTRENMIRELEIAEASRTVEMLEKRSELTSHIIAPETGRVLEIMAAEGDRVSVSQAVFSFESQGIDKNLLEGVVYVSLKDGKQVKPGMMLQITPASVKREEFGFILGKVLSVSPFPATPQGMQSVLGNSQLVQTLMAGGAPIGIRAELQRDPTSPSGYRWSTGKGPDLLLTSGTLCDASIVVREQSPLSLLLPTLKNFTGL
ncbi:MAG: NHLP bacteriocin system secretion protein [Candidatus Riflebacteria bacterium]|nr:NHLP bacteriocin system secretion protein [Candidatus Riflebacteria bacterium]